MSTNTKPSIITSISGDGPCKALDLATVPAQLMRTIAQAAMRVAEEWNNCNISTEYLGAETALNDLVAASDAIENLLTPVIPGGQSAGRIHLMVVDDYPVIRDGQVVRVKPGDLSALELEALQSWLHYHASVTAHHAEAIKQRVDNLTSETA